MLLQPCFVAKYMKVFSFSLDYFKISFYHPPHYLVVDVNSPFFLLLSKSQQSVLSKEITQGGSAKFVTV